MEPFICLYNKARTTAARSSLTGSHCSLIVCNYSNIYFTITVQWLYHMCILSEYLSKLYIMFIVVSFGYQRQIASKQ